MTLGPIWITPAGDLGTIPEEQFYQFELNAQDPGTIVTIGNITSNSASPVITGVGTSFNSTDIGKWIYNELAQVKLGTVAFVSNASSLVLTSNAVVNSANVPYKLVNPIQFNLVSGALPKGIHLDEAGTLAGSPITEINVLGVPFQVSTSITSQFGIRAKTLDNVIADRTFSLTVVGQNPPQILSTSENLGTYIDGSYVDITIPVVDLDLIDQLSWSVVTGTLPPGLILDELTGRIHGYIEPLILPANTDLISQTFEFTIQVSDGKSIDTSSYFLKVYAINFLTADRINDITVDDSGITVDIRNKHAPVIYNEISDLGSVVHDNYYHYQFKGIDFDEDPIRFINTIEGSYNLPPGLEINQESGWLHGNIPVLDNYENEYNFKVKLYKTNASLATKLPKKTSAGANFTVAIDSDLVTASAGVFTSDWVGRYLSNAAGEILGVVEAYLSTTQVNLSSVSLVAMTAEPGYYLNQVTTNIIGNGTITANIASNLIIGSGTGFASTHIGSLLYGPDNQLIGVIESVANANAVIMQNNSVSSLAGTNYSFNYNAISSPGYVAHADDTKKMLYDINGNIIGLGGYKFTVGPYDHLAYVSDNKIIGRGTLNVTPYSWYGNIVGNGTNFTINDNGKCLFHSNGQVFAYVMHVVNSTFAHAQVDNTYSNISYYKSGALPSDISFSVYRQDSLVTTNVSSNSVTYDAGIFNSSDIGKQIYSKNGVYVGTIKTIVSNANVTLESNSSVAITSERSLIIDYISNNTPYKLTVIGDKSGLVTWLTESDLGTINTGQNSELSILAETESGHTLYYELLSGGYNKLPRGLKLLPDGLIVGKVSFSTFMLDGGLTTIDVNSVNYDETTFDNEYTFTVRVYDVEGLVNTTKEFKIKVIKRTNLPIENLYIIASPGPTAKKFLLAELTNNSIVTPSYLYRATDPNFGIATDFRFLLNYGLRPKVDELCLRALEKNHYNKILQFGDLKVAQALDSNDEPMYEVVYIEIKDELLTDAGLSPADSINSGIDVDEINLIPDGETKFTNSSGDANLYPNSLLNMKNRISSIIGHVSKDDYPLWMKSKQNNGQILGFTFGCVLCYVKPGYGDLIKYRIEESQFRYHDIEFKLDRYIWDNSSSQNFNKITESYLVEKETTFDNYSSLLTDLNSNNLVLTQQISLASPAQFTSNTMTTTVASTSLYLASLSNIKEHMLIQGTGISANTYVTTINTYDNSIVMSIAASVNSGTVITFTSRSLYFNSTRNITLDQPVVGANISANTTVLEIYPDEIVLSNTISSGIAANANIEFYSNYVNDQTSLPNLDANLLLNRTTFDNYSMRFIRYTDQYQAPDDGDKYLKFIQENIFS